jgi:hypothetical protein
MLKKVVIFEDVCLSKDISKRHGTAVVIIYPTSSTGGKQSSSKMSNSDGIVQTNQPFSLKRKKKKSKSYEQFINNGEREMRLLCLFSLFFSNLQWKRTKREEAWTLRTNAAWLLPNQRAGPGRPSDFCYYGVHTGCVRL